MWFVVVWIICGAIAAHRARGAGETGTSSCAAFFLGPVGLLISFSVSGPRKTCPFCKEPIRPDALVCPHCQREQPSIET
jgi:hypothetical protein